MDTTPATIRIGGTLVVTPENVSTVCKFANEVLHNSKDWGEESYIEDCNQSVKDWSDNLYLKGRDSHLPDEVKEALRDVSKDEGRIICQDSNARNGEFEELEKFCRELGLSYDRDHGPFFEYDGELAMFRPDMQEPHTTYCDDFGEPIIRYADLKAMMNQSKDFDHLKKMVNDQCGQDIPELEKFSIVDEG